MNFDKYVFGGRYHFENFFKEHFIHLSIPLELIPINGYYFEKSERLQDFIQFYFNRYFPNNLSSRYFNPFDSYTLKLICERKLLNKKEIVFLKDELGSYYAAVRKFNQKLEQNTKIVHSVKNKIKKFSVFTYSLTDYPLLDIRVDRYDYYEATNYFNLNIFELIKICPLAIEYLILTTDYFCIENFDYELASQINFDHHFLDITFEINELKTKLPQHQSRTFIEFETQRMLSAIKSFNYRVDEIELYETKDDYDRFERSGIHYEYMKLESLISLYERNLTQYKEELKSF